MPAGYVGKGLQVDFTSGKTQEEKISDEILRQFFPSYKDGLKEYYKLMGWDEETGRSLPQTLKRLGLEYAIPEVE
ncbi:MAG: aldehyde ferredoxin oxidoreductase C-terminal domain-containing protein [Candidatus Hodarchaeota archaeon]